MIEKHINRKDKLNRLKYLSTENKLINLKKEVKPNHCKVMI